MPKKTSDLVDHCNTFVTTGFHLADLDAIKNDIRAAVKFFSQGDTSVWPNAFACSHCNSPHSLDPEKVRTALFTGPGAIDFVATYDEFVAMITGKEAAAAGEGWNNGANVNSDSELSSLLNGTPEVPTEATPEDSTGE